ncbi:chemotaxis protein CheA [Zobellella aerophila]|uniref:Chemotaxis protein CheA n=1 Tax=Zobellella aerophila TaxID=870480 RepID=A0ABP6VRU8_9GAMM
MDITDFYDTFFEEAEELLDDMERHLLELDVDDPDAEQLNAIFRAAHSIKGGAGTFGFDALQHTTHLLENLLDHTRRGELKLRRDIVDTFLEAKDMLHDQLDTYRRGTEPDPEAYERICRVLQQLAQEEIGQRLGDAGQAAPAPAPAVVAEAPVSEAEHRPQPASLEGGNLAVVLRGVADKDRQLLQEELKLFGDIVATREQDDRYEIALNTTASADDIEAVMCFIVEPEQLEIRSSTVAAPVEVAAIATEPEVQAPVPAPVDDIKPAGAPAPARRRGDKPGGGGKGAETASIRVPVDKVDQIINLVGELIITQSMLVQTVSELDGGSHSALFNGMNLLQRNARDLQEAVMSIRMVPMDYVFSRFPRLVRDLAAKLDKDVELLTLGESTELDKSLTERIIDPLTHLVRNSLDHGIEGPEAREAAGKPRAGRLTLSAQHQGGNILIEVSDDGAGLNRGKLLAKARANGLNVSDNMSDDEVWQLIFAPGFSTAEQVSDVSGRGVGMDVVKRNIQAMGGHVELLSRAGQGTTTRIVLPLTLAILDGMLIKVGGEVFILPLSAVIESLQPTHDHLYAMAREGVLLKVREEYLPVIAVHQVLDVADAQTEPTDSIAVIVQGEGRRYALLVDELLGQQQVVVKNLETNYRKVPGVSAATILGDGSVALILDIADMHRLSHVKKEAGRAAESVKPMLLKEVVSA